MPTAAETSCFSVTVTGQIESAYFPDFDNIYCKYSFAHGPDWIVTSVESFPCLPGSPAVGGQTGPRAGARAVQQGLEEGITQITRAPGAREAPAAGEEAAVPASVWNFPLEISFRSTNAFGWPQIVLAVYGMDALGRDVVRGYGAARLPIEAGRETLYVPMFVPLATSPVNGFLSWLAGRLPEFLDAKFVSRSEGREVTRVRSQGTVKVVVDATLEDMEKFGYSVGRRPASSPLYESQAPGA